jgi:hypothetical protein
MFVKSTRITLDNAGVGITFTPSLDPRFQIRNLLLCAREPALGAGERIDHFSPVSV